MLSITTSEIYIVRVLTLVLLLTLAGCSTFNHTPAPGHAPVATIIAPPPIEPVIPKPEVRTIAPKIALVLGGGAARGFAHIGVIKALEANGIVPDMVVGTSAGSLVGALYSSGYRGADLERVAQSWDDTLLDWSLPDRGFIKGEALQNFVNQAVQNRTLDKLNRTFGVVATDLKSGEQVIFRNGNTGMAVRASSSVPGIFQPVKIGDREYVDGGLTSPVPVRAARAMGANVVIAVDITNVPRFGKTDDSIDILLQTFAIMGERLAGYELPDADVVIHPDTGKFRSTDFTNRRQAIIEGEKAGQAAIAEIRRAIASKTRTIPATAVAP